MGALKQTSKTLSPPPKSNCSIIPPCALVRFSCLLAQHTYTYNAPVTSFLGTNLLFLALRLRFETGFCEMRVGVRGSALRRAAEGSARSGRRSICVQCRQERRGNYKIYPRTC